MKTKNLLKTIFGIFLLTFLVVPFVSAGYTSSYYESLGMGSNSMTLTQGETTNLVLTAISHNNIPLTWERVEAIQGANTYLLQQWTESGTKTYSNYIFGKTYTLDSGILNPGTYTLRFSAMTNTGVLYSDLTLIVESQTSSNTAPVLNSIGSKSINENSNLQFTILATDADGDTLTYSVSNLPTGATFNSNTGVFSWTPTYEQSGSYQITFRVSDGQGGSDLETITIIVNNVNRAPVLEFISSQQVNEGDTHTYNVEATDADGDSLTYSLIGAYSWLSINSNTGVISGIAPSVSADTNYHIAIRVSDGESIDTQTYILTVLDIPEGGDEDAPIITAVTPLEGGVYYVSDLTLEVTTNEDASVYYSLDGGANIQMDNVGSNTYTYDATIADGDHAITFSATDVAGNTGYLTVNFGVDTSSGPDTEDPVITVIRPLEGHEYDNEIVFEIELNEECQTVTYSLDGATAVTMTEDSALTFVSEELELEDGEYTVVFTATDLAGNTASVTINFEIDEGSSDKDEDRKWESDSYFDAMFIDQYNPKTTTIDLTDDEPLVKLKWWQRLINWIVELFGGEAIY